MSAALRIEIVTFNANEASAVESLFDDIAAPGTAWGRSGRDGIVFGGAAEVRLRHSALRAQGNVIAATKLAELFTDEELPDFVIFYGCAGCLNSAFVNHAFLIESVSYASLGTVEASGQIAPNAERVTLKNKWLCDVDDAEVTPLDAIRFPEAGARGTLNLRTATGIDEAYVIATDKVVRIAPDSSPPAPTHAGPPRPIYKKGEWSYGAALAFAQAQNPQGRALVEMESYGIASVARAMKFLPRVIVVRVVTDSLTDHAASDVDQKDLLFRGRIALGRVLLAIVSAQRSF